MKSKDIKNLMPKTFTKKENKNLPVPRLEIRYSIDPNPSSIPSAKYKDYIAIYSLVYEHLTGDIISQPFGCTYTNSSEDLENLSLPFRDGAHIKNEMLQLNLPGFLIKGDLVEEIKIDIKNLPSALLNKIKKQPN